MMCYETKVVFDYIQKFNAKFLKIIVTKMN